MESGNSSSMQSSSGGGGGGADDDFDSRPFFSSSSSTAAQQDLMLPYNHTDQAQTQPPLPALFDPYDSSPLLNHDLLWPPPPPPGPSTDHQFLGASIDDSTLMGAATMAGGGTEGGGGGGGGGVVVTRPKKRTRASRRAPTTVLATDTSNFRAMVQQYTGIPASPYSAVSSSSSPFSRRLDLIRSPFTGGRGGGGGGGGSSGVDNLFRPAAQNNHTAGVASIFPFTNTTIAGDNMGRRDCRDVVDGINIFANFNSNNHSFQSLNNNNNNNHRNPMAAALPRMPLGFDGLPQMTFQNLLSSQFSSMTYPCMVSNTAAAPAASADPFGATFNDQSIGVANNSNLGVEDGLGLSHDHVGGFSGVGLGSDGTGPKNDDHDHDENANAGGNEGFATEGVNYVVNCGSSSSTTNLQRDQLVESSAAGANSRGEGTLASWINSPS